MKNLVIAALALLVGVVVGGFGPRWQIQKLDRQILELESRPCDGSGLGSGLAAVLGASRPPPVQPPEPEPPAPDLAPEPAADTDTAPQPDPPPVAVIEPAPPGFQGGLPEGGMDAAREALELRRTQARAALIEDAGADEDQIAEIDAAFGKMNDELLVLAEDLADTMQQGQEPTRRETMEFAADALSIMLDAEDKVNGALDAEQREGLSEASVDPTSYLDPKLLDVLQSLDR